MSLGRSGVHRRGRMATAAMTVGALAVFQALAIIGAGAAAASGTCTYSLQNQEINITIDGGTSSSVAVDDGTVVANGAILFDGAACGSANITNTTVIEVLGQPSTDEQFVIDNGGLSFDVPFPSSISWFVDLGTGTGDVLLLAGSSADDVFTVTNTSFDMNGGVGTTSGVDNLVIGGGDGDDVLDASATSIHNGLGGGPGDDVLSPGTFDGDNVQGAAGVDTLSYATRTTSTTIDNVAGLAGTDVNGDCDVTDAGDETDTEGGFEIKQTGSGDDCFDGSVAITETFIPGDGDDEINAQDADTIDWSSSSAGIVIDVPNESATGQGADEWTTDDGPDNFIGSAFDDTLLVDDDAPGPGVVSFSGGDGVDTVDGSASTGGIGIDLDALDPEPDDVENAIGGSGNDNLDGNDLRNSLTGNDGDDDLDGDEGNDTFFGGLGNDDFTGDDGADTVSYAQAPGPGGQNVDLSLLFATGSEGDDSFGDTIEIVVGSPFNDTITGGPFEGGGTRNFLFKGGAGKDRLTGFNGNDTLNGGGGKDTLRGVGGDDTLNGKGGNDLLAGGGGFDIGNGGKGKDVCKSVEQKSNCGKAGNPKAPQTAVGRRD